MKKPTEQPEYFVALLACVIVAKGNGDREIAAAQLALDRYLARLPDDESRLGRLSAMRADFLKLTLPGVIKDDLLLEMEQRMTALAPRERTN
jgi:hypothetical protein